MVGLLIFLQKWLQSHKTGLVIGQRYSRWEGDTLNDWSNWLDNEVRSQLWCFALFPLDWHIQCTVNGSWLRPRDDVGMQKRNAKRNKQKIQKMHNILFAFLPTSICSMPRLIPGKMQAVSFGSLQIYAKCESEKISAR